jgi:hypothetical protein
VGRRDIYTKVRKSDSSSVYIYRGEDFPNFINMIKSMEAVPTIIRYGISRRNVGTGFFRLYDIQGRTME